MDVPAHLTKAAAARKHHYKSIIHRFADTLPARMSPHYRCPVFNLQRKSSTEHRAEGEEQDSRETFHGKGELVGNSFNRLSSICDLHLSFLLKDRCIHSPSNLSPLSEFQEHL